MDTTSETQEQITVKPPEIQTDKPSMLALRDISKGKEPCRSLTPDFRADNILGIDFSYLHSELGVEDIYFDVDNTLTHTKGDVINSAYLPFLLEQKAAGHLPHIHLASDSGRDLSTIAETLGADRIPTPRIRRKQSHHYWNKLAKGLPSPQNAVMIGDSPIWDMRGANSVGMLTIMVEPFSAFAGIEHAAFKPYMDDRARRKIDELYGDKVQPPTRTLQPTTL